MDEALAPLGRLGREAVARKRGDHVGHQLERVHEPPLRRAGMDADAVDREHELVGRERLRLDLAEPGAVERVREVGAERVEVEVVGAPADLLVDRERDPRRRARARRRASSRRAAVTMIATPALSSAPSSVVPSLVTRSWPSLSASPGMSSGSSTCDGSPGSTIGSPSQAAVDDRRDPRAGRRRRRVDVGDQPDRRASVDRARARSRRRTRARSARRRRGRSRGARRRAAARGRAASRSRDRSSSSGPTAVSIAT